MTKENKKSLLVVCGEVSSDQHTAPIIGKLLEKHPELNVYGMGGRSLRNSGMELLVDAEKEASVMGFTEVLAKIPSLLGFKRQLEKEVDIRQTEVALLVDFPDFNLRLAKTLKRKGVKIIYFISPQLWAWRKGRIHQVKKYIDKVIPIFPFEEEFYKTHNVDATYIGHPFLDKEKVSISKEEFCTHYNLDPNKQILGLLPGSRATEIRNLVPIFNEVYRKLRVERPELQVVLPIAPGVRPLIRELICDGIVLVNESAREVLAFSRASVVASGTATVEAALAGNPFFIVYKVSTLTYIIGKLLIRGVKFIGMPNLIAKKKIIEELIQSDCNAENILNQINIVLDDSVKRDEIIAGLEVVRKNLGEVKQNSVANGVSSIIETYLY